jgi:outer membrane protein TolC
MVIRAFSLIFSFLVFTVAFAQVQQDANKIMPFEQYIGLVKQNHPYINAINIITKKADAELTMSRSGFDPYLSYEAGSKKFIENYYQYSNAELKLPLWWGIDLQSGIQFNNGPRLDNSISTGQNAYLGINIPLLKNLVYDKRRAAVQMAKVAQKQSVAEQIIERNNFLYDAIVAYWRWSASLELYSMAERLFDNNQNRLKFVKNSVVFGDRPAIDSVEQLTQLQMFNLQKQNFFLDYRTAHFFMGAYLVDSSLTTKPQISSKTNIPNLSKDSLMNTVETIVMNHPILQQYQNKLLQLKIERKLKAQSLLPTLNVGFNILSKNDPSTIIFEENYIQNNRQFTIKAGIPLRLSEGRGGYRFAQLKLKEQAAVMEFKTLELRSKMNMVITEVLNFNNQMNILEAVILNYKKLLDAEEQKFKLGESSLFLINSRELKLFEAQQKLIETKFKAIKAYYSYLKTAALIQ